MWRQWTAIVTIQGVAGWRGQATRQTDAIIHNIYILIRILLQKRLKMRAALLVFACVWWRKWSITTGLLIPRALHAPTISLEEYGVVLKPGCMMSTADVTHVQQGFRVPIPQPGQ